MKIVAPHAGQIHNFGPRLAGLMEKLDALKFPTVGALPLLAGVIGLDRDQVESRLRQALVSTDEQAIDAALIAAEATLARREAAVDRP
jgi:hypothetical protein